MRHVFKRFALLGVFLLVGLLAPIGYIELACRPSGETVVYESLLPPEHHRPEGRTLLTYPEWHIVHAYDDYAEVIRTGDPHDFGYLSSIGGFWTSLCNLSKATGEHGGFPGDFKQTVYTIGVSFTAELLFKGLYEETIGRFATWIRGDSRAPLDDLSAEQAKQYSAFLRQVPWYKWDFTSDAAALRAESTPVFRDRERRFALGLEYGAKAQYANVIAAAVATIEPDALTLRMIVADVDAEDLENLADLAMIGVHDQGVEIETPRYRALTNLLLQMAESGANFVEIAGNDDILFSAISNDPEHPNALYSFQRQGYGDTRHLVLVPVTDLAAVLRRLVAENLILEHIHDY